MSIEIKDRERLITALTYALSHANQFARDFTSDVEKVGHLFPEIIVEADEFILGISHALKDYRITLTRSLAWMQDDTGMLEFGDAQATGDEESECFDKEWRLLKDLRARLEKIEFNQG